MTRVAAEVHESTESALPPGLYLCEFPDDGFEHWAWLKAISGAPSPLIASQAPNGEVAVYNALLEPDAYLQENPVALDLVTQRWGAQSFSPGVAIFDGGAAVPIWGQAVHRRGWAKHVLRDGPADNAVLFTLGDLTLLPNAPSDYQDAGSAGSARMAGDVRAAVRVSAAHGSKWAPHTHEQLVTNLQRPGIGLFGLDEQGAPIFFFGNEHEQSTCDGGYRSAGAWGSKVHGASEHFGRPEGEFFSPWKPDDYYHFAAQQWIHVAAQGSVAAAVHVVGMFGRMWIHLRKGKISAARGYRMAGDAADAARVFAMLGGHWQRVADHLIEEFLPALLNKLDAESARIDQVHEGHAWADMLSDGVDPLQADDATWLEYLEKNAPAFRWNVAQHGESSDHPDDTQCPWMTGQLGLGLLRVERLLRDFGLEGSHLYAQTDRQLRTLAEFLVDHSFFPAHDDHGWPEDLGPFGDVRASSKHAITGKYRQWLLPCLEALATWAMERASAAEAEGESAQAKTWQSLAARCLKRANWLAREIVKGHWYGSSARSDKGWAPFVADEGWRTAARLGTTEAEWEAALGVVV